MRTYVIGDIHGCNRTFQALLGRLALRPGDTVVLLGDLIDRGPDSKGVVDTVWRLQDERGVHVICLRGNHEQLLLDALDDPQHLDAWLFNGGRQTLHSFGLDHPEALPAAYLQFFYKMPHWHEIKGYLCVHGGLDFSAPDPLERTDAMLWIRRWYDQIDYTWLGERIILHGHTPVDMEAIRAQYNKLPAKQYLNLDNGCVYALLEGGRAGLGALLAIRLEDPRELIGVQNVD